jgi:hypothetical protein
MEHGEIGNRIKALLTEVKVYKAQGLLDEAKERLELLQKLIDENKPLTENNGLAEEVSIIGHDLQDEIERVEKASRAPEMSVEFQDIVMEKFSFSGKSDKAVLEGAIALVQFGQFERALGELEPLLEKEEVRFLAAKNILRCHMALTSIDDAIDKYREWNAGNIFNEDELDKLYLFLSEVLNKRGISKAIPRGKGLDKAGVVDAGSITDDIHEGDLPEIISVEIILEKGGKRNMIDFDVHSQSADTISLLVSSGDSSLEEVFNPGIILKEIRFYSHMSLFVGSGEVRSRSRVDSDTGNEDYLVEIRIL